MKKSIVLFVVVFLLPLSFSSAQGMMMWQKATTTDDHTAQEEAEGKEVWNKLQAGTIKCGELSDEQFGTLGEYFMGQMTGDTHALMNQRITQIMGEEGEEAMHVVLGKRLSGCDTSSEFPAGSDNFIMPMMGGWSSSLGDNNFKKMHGGYNYLGMGGFGWLGEILWWILIIAGIVFLIRYFKGDKGTAYSGRNALDILKERYARGEIDKMEFDAKKKDIS